MFYVIAEAQFGVGIGEGLLWGGKLWADNWPGLSTRLPPRPF